MERTDTSIDSEKRGKMLLLAAILALAMFVHKILQDQVELVTWRIYLDASVYFLITFTGLIWCFDFQIKLKSFWYIFQASFFVFSEAIFIEFFFFQKFGRIYEIFILFILLSLAFLGNYVSFLMANVFNVSLFKKLPLVHVARTSSYLLTLLMMYFLTFSFLASNLQIYILIPLILISYPVITLIHYINIGVEEESLFRKTLLTSLISIVLFLGMFLTGNSHEIVSLLPVIGYYFCVSAITKETLSKEFARFSYFSIIILVIVFFISLYFNITN